jgi:hypothetical protein
MQAGRAPLPALARAAPPAAPLPAPPRCPLPAAAARRPWVARHHVRRLAAATYGRRRRAGGAWCPTPSSRRTCARRAIKRLEQGRAGAWCLVPVRAGPVRPGHVCRHQGRHQGSSWRARLVSSCLCCASWFALALRSIGPLRLPSLLHVSLRFRRPDVPARRLVQRELHAACPDGAGTGQAKGRTELIKQAAQKLRCPVCVSDL